MGPRLDRDGLRGAVYLADVSVLVDVLDHDIWPADALQLLGEAVLVAAGEQADRVRSSGRRCAARLRARDWEGDSELADQIASALGLGPPPVLRPLAVDLEELAGVLEGDHRLNGGGRIDVRTGEVWALAAVEYAEEVGELDSDEVDDQGWLEVVCEGSRAAYRDMEMFIDRLDDVRVADRLGRSIQGRGAFRRFKDVLAGAPELLEGWYGFSDDRRRGRARAWLAVQGYSATPPTASPAP